MWQAWSKSEGKKTITWEDVLGSMHVAIAIVKISSNW